MKNAMRILIGIAFALCIAFGKMLIFRAILPTHEYGMSFHFLVHFISSFTRIKVVIPEVLLFFDDLISS